MLIGFLTFIDWGFTGSVATKSVGVFYSDVLFLFKDEILRVGRQRVSGGKTRTEEKVSYLRVLLNSLLRTLSKQRSVP